MNPREITAVTPPTAPPNIIQAIATMMMKIVMTSNQPARTSDMNNLRLITVTERKMNRPNINSASKIPVSQGLIPLSISIGLISASGREDQTHNVSVIIMNTTARVAVITVERIIWLLSGVSSLTVVHTDLENRDFTFHS